MAVLKDAFKYNLLFREVLFSPESWNYFTSQLLQDVLHCSLKRAEEYRDVYSCRIPVVDNNYVTATVLVYKVKRYITVHADNVPETLFYYNPFDLFPAFYAIHLWNKKLLENPYARWKAFIKELSKKGIYITSQMIKKLPTLKHLDSIYNLDVWKFIAQMNGTDPEHLLKKVVKIAELAKNIGYEESIAKEKEEEELPEEILEKLKKGMTYEELVRELAKRKK